MATILEALQNAKINLIDNAGKGPLPEFIGKEQLKNAVTLLYKGYDLNDDVEEVTEAYDSVDDVPEKENN